MRVATLAGGRLKESGVIDDAAPPPPNNRLEPTNYYTSLKETVRNLAPSNVTN